MAIIKKMLNTFWTAHKFLVKKNIDLKDIHAGETCLLFGNGGSLKYYDLSVLPKYTAIGTGYSLTDNRLKDVDMKYWIIPDSYALYPVIWKPGTTGYHRNRLLPIFKRIISKNKNRMMFISLTNIYSFLGLYGKTRYFHHFEDKTSGSNDLAGKFSSCFGSLDIMLGMAKYMGFKKAIILGCDYVGSPKLEGHFYSDKHPSIGEDDPGYCQRIQKSVQGIEVLFVFPKGITSKYFPSATFEELFHTPDRYQPNYENIDKEYLELMRGSRHIYM